MRRFNLTTTRLATMFAAIGLGSMSQVLACQPYPMRVPVFNLPAAEAKLPFAYIKAQYFGPPSGCPIRTFDNFIDLTSISDADWNTYVGDQVVTPPLPAAWQSSQSYVAGDLASYDGKSYKAKWWTQNEQPGTAWSAWEEQTAEAPGSLGAWSVGKAYTGGNQVNYGGFIYTAKWWTQGDTPTDSATSPWTKNGPFVEINAPSTARPAPYTAKITASSTNYTINWQTAGFSTSSNALAQYWELRENGIAVYRGTAATAVTACPPPTANAPTCTAQYLQSGSAVVPRSAASRDYWRSTYLSLWVCTTASVCRPTPKFDTVF